ncbi:hypothetical protein BH24DEI2_BH24DEI2_09240 [soil metagenome]
MLVAAALAALVYALVNAFGAWMVARRKPWLAGLFMVAACLLTVACAALVFAFPYTLTLLATGLVTASVASFINAHVMLGGVVWRFHLLRAAVGLGIYWLAAGLR